MSKDPSCVGQSRTDVIGLQTRVFSQDSTLRNALGQHAHDELHWDASPTDDRFAQHKLGVEADTLLKLCVHRFLPASVTKGQHMLIPSIGDTQLCVHQAHERGSYSICHL